MATEKVVVSRRGVGPTDSIPRKEKLWGFPREKKSGGLFLRLLTSLFSGEMRGEKCMNKSEKKYYKRRFKSCPVPSYRRYGTGRDRPPYYCCYCSLKDDPEPEEKG